MDYDPDWKQYYESLMQAYDDRIRSYDSDIVEAQWRGPHYTAETVKRHIPSNKNAKILDVCGGTGAVAANLSKMGYDNMDYLDGSNEMAREALRRNLYQTYIRQIIPEDQPTIIRSGIYDLAMISGGHITTGKIDDMLRVLKKGGLLIATMVETTEVDRKEALKVFAHFEALGKSCCQIVEHKKVNDMMLRADETLAPGHIIVVKKL